MNAVLYYSNTGSCHAIAQYAANLLGFPAMELLNTTEFIFDNLVLVFPVHCQSIPVPIRPVLRKITAGNVIILAAYGKMHFGNVLWECAKNYRWNMIGGAYIPTKHSYLPEDALFTDYARLGFLADRFAVPQPVPIPRQFRNPLSGFFPGLRSRMGVKLRRNKDCNNCGLCTAACHSKKCIRCLKCVQACPRGALNFKLSFFMKLYLRKRKKNALVIY